MFRGCPVRAERNGNSIIIVTPIIPHPGTAREVPKEKVFHFSESCGRLVSEKMGRKLFLDKNLSWIPG